VREQLAGLGFTVAVRPTPGHPVVVAQHPGPAGYTGPHVLFYGHYDVQPVDPLALWQTPPFEPQFVDGPHGKRFVARGAVDDKGQSMMFMEALRASTTTKCTARMRSSSSAASTRRCARTQGF
jgi:acetylornithine deacetylase/succinyl-diaminopimelate desuccinylase-like protein